MPDNRRSRRFFCRSQRFFSSQNLKRFYNSQLYLEGVREENRRRWVGQTISHTLGRQFSQLAVFSLAVCSLAVCHPSHMCSLQPCSLHFYSLQFAALQVAPLPGGAPNNAQQVVFTSSALGCWQRMLGWGSGSPSSTCAGPLRCPQWPTC